MSTSQNVHARNDERVVFDAQIHGVDAANRAGWATMAVRQSYAVPVPTDCRSTAAGSIEATWQTQVRAKTAPRIMAEVTLEFIGCGDAFASGGRFQTCFLVRGSDRPFLIDCGASAPVALQRRGVESVRHLPRDRVAPARRSCRVGSPSSSWMRRTTGPGRSRS